MLSLKKYQLLLLLVFNSFSQAQDMDCQDRIMNKTGVILRTTKYKAPANPTTQNAFLDATQKLILGRYTPRGIALEPYHTYPVDDNQLLNSYTFTCYVKRFRCKGDSLEMGIDKVGSYSIDFNLLLPLLNPFKETDNDNNYGGAGFPSLPNGEAMPTEIMPGIWERSIRYREEANKEWLITYDGKLPFSYVSQKEFLNKQISMLDRAKKKATEAYKESIAQLESNKKQYEQEWKNDPAKLEKYIRMDYDPGLQDARRNYESSIQNIDAALEHVKEKLQGPEAELSKPAIVIRSQANSYEYELSDNANQNFANTLFKPNPDYFNKTLSKSIPQVIYVRLQYFINYPAEELFGKEIESATDFNYLRACIGKATPPPVTAN